MVFAGLFLFVILLWKSIPRKKRSLKKNINYLFSRKAKFVGHRSNWSKNEVRNQNY